jgi:hypothetical protein
MKTITKIILILLPLFMLSGKASKAQDLRDTIVTKSNEFIVCKIIKITDTDIEYKKDKEADAIVYVIAKTKVRQIRYSNGKREFILPDEMDMNKEAQIIDKRNCIKVQFFSPFYGHLSFTYEMSYKMGTNFETTVGLINNTLMKSGTSDQSHLTQGATLIFGPKFILGESFYIKGMKYSHPLKGRYIKPEIILTSFTVKDLKSYYQTQTSDLRVNCASLMLTYGNQWILGNIFTFGFNVGVGYSFISTKYSNPDFINNIGYFDEASNYTNNLFNQLRIGSNTSSALAFTSNITFGYIFK